MTFEEFKTACSEVLSLATPETQARTSELLTTLSDGFELLTTENATNAEKVTELTNNNETLRAVNAKLFLKVGEIPKETPAPQTPTPEEESGLAPVDFATLFNEKGELL